MWGCKCFICKKRFLCHVGLFSHLENHIENAQRQNEESGATTTFVVEMEVPEISMEVRTEFVEIEVTATTITESSVSGRNFVSSVPGLTSSINIIVSENTITEVTLTSSESESADGTSSPDMDPHENTSDLDARPNLVAEPESKSTDGTTSPDMDSRESNLDAPPNLVAGATGESLESRSVHCASLPELEIPTMVASEVIVRTENCDYGNDL